MDKRRAHGMDFQRWIKDWIIEAHPGVVVHNQRPNHIPVGPGKWVCQDNDIFGCIDLVAIKPDGSRPAYIQATLDTHIGRKLSDLLEVPWPLEHCRVQIWVKRSPTRISIKELTADKTLVDIGEINRRKYVAR